MAEEGVLPGVPVRRQRAADLRRRHARRTDRLRRPSGRLRRDGAVGVRRTRRFVARRERDRSIRTRQGLQAERESQLSDRQLEVLKTAYYSGFFASPRQSTGGDVADILGVSQPTVTEQLGTAQRKVFELLFTDPSSDA